MDASQLNELDAAIRRPETVVEIEAEMLARDRAQRLYDQSNMYGGEQWIDDYEAGWKAAKAYYESGGIIDSNQLNELDTGSERPPMTLREMIVQVTGINSTQTVLDLEHPILAYELAPVAELRLGYKRLVRVKLSHANKAIVLIHEGI